jgi:hypothetical protein
MTNPFQHYAWLIYAIIAFVYTMFEFGISFTKFSTLIFSERNSRKHSTVIGIHIAFLAILMGFVWFAFYFYESRYNSLPDWLTERRGRGGSWYEIFCILVILLIGVIERQWIYVRSVKDNSETASLERH